MLPTLTANNRPKGTAFRAFPRPGTNVPRPGTFIPRRGTIWKHCLLGVWGKEIMGNDDKFNYQEFLLGKRPEVERWSKEMWRQRRIDLKISLVIIVEESEYFSIISPNFFPKYIENSR